MIKLGPSTRKNKKYMAMLENGKIIHFGASDYQQFKDSTGIGAYSNKNHGNKERRRRYFLRHSGVPTKKLALQKELKKSKGNYTAKILSHLYLW